MYNLSQLQKQSNHIFETQSQSILSAKEKKTTSYETTS